MSFAAALKLHRDRLAARVKELEGLVERFRTERDGAQQQKPQMNEPQTEATDENNPREVVARLQRELEDAHPTAGNNIIRYVCEGTIAYIEFMGQMIWSDDNDPRPTGDLFTVYRWCLEEVYWLIGDLAAMKINHQITAAHTRAQNSPEAQAERADILDAKLEAARSDQWLQEECKRQALRLEFLRNQVRNTGAHLTVDEMLELVTLTQLELAARAVTTDKKRPPEPPPTVSITTKEAQVEAKTGDACRATAALHIIATAATIAKSPRFAVLKAQSKDPGTPLSDHELRELQAFQLLELSLDLYNNPLKQ